MKRIYLTIICQLFLCKFAQTQNFSSDNNIQNYTLNNKVNTSFDPIRVNSSANAYSIALSQQNALSANKDLNLIMLTHRGGPINGTSGQILSTYSTNGGTTWDTLNIIYNGSPNQGRYPSGVIYNPPGNTVINNAWAVVGGPGLNSGANSFGYDCFAWKQFGGNTPVKYVKEHLINKRICINNMQVTNAGTFWMTGEANTDNGSQITAFNNVLWKGVFNSGVITWTDQIFSTNLLTKPSTGFPAGKPTSSVAFSEDGQTGYFITFGIPAGTTNYYYRPIVKKTTNGGQTWVDLPDFNFSNLNQFSKYLPHTIQGDLVPHFNIIKDAIVDKNGHLHILSVVDGGASTSVDSVDKVITNWAYKYYLFDTYTTDNGWDVELVDSIKSPEVLYGLGDISYDERAQMAVSTDGAKIFYTWVDTDQSYQDNRYPNLIISAFDVDSKARTESFNITKNTAYSDKAYLHTTAPQVWKNDTTYTIHNVITQVGNSDIVPVSYLYLQGIKMHESDFKYIPVSYTVVNPNAGILSASVNNVPINPFSKHLKGISATFNANPYSGYAVKYWKVNNVIVAGNHTNTLVLNNIQENTHVTVEYDYIITFEVINGNGTLTATANGNPINSGTTFTMGQNIVFTASPDPQYVVREWKNNNMIVQGNSSNTYEINSIQSSANVTVEFRLQNASLLTFDVSWGFGSITATVDGVNTLTNSYIENGNNIVFTATPAAGYRIKNWKLNNNIISGNTSNSYELTDIQQDSDVKVEFEQITYTVSYSVVGGNGSLVAIYNSNLVSSNAQIPQGANVEFMANPLPSHQVKEWKLNDNVVVGNTSNTLNVSNLFEDINVTVEYEERSTYDITFSVVGGNGSILARVDGINITSGSTVLANKDVIFTAIPNTNYYVKEWRLNNSIIPGNTSNTFSIVNLQENSDVTVEFRVDDVRISNNENPSIHIFPNPSTAIFNIQSDHQYKMEVIDIQGRILISKQIEKGMNELDMSIQNDGVYFMRLSNSEGMHVLKINKMGK